MPPKKTTAASKKKQTAPKRKRGTANEGTSNALVENVTEDVSADQTGSDDNNDTEIIPLVWTKPFLITGRREAAIFSKLEKETVRPPRYVDSVVLSDLQIYARVKSLLKNLNLLKYAGVQANAHVKLCREFYTTFKVEDKGTIVRCRLNNEPVDVTSELMEELFGLSFEGPTSVPKEFDTASAWLEIKMAQVVNAKHFKPVFGHMITVLGAYFDAPLEGEVVEKRAITARELLQVDLAIDRHEIKPHHDRKCVKAYIKRVEEYQKGKVVTNAERIDREVLLSSEPHQEATEQQEPTADQPADVTIGHPNSEEIPHPVEHLRTSSTTPCPTHPTGPSTTSDYGNHPWAAIASQIASLDLRMMDRLDGMWRHMRSMDNRLDGMNLNNTCTNFFISCIILLSKQSWAAHYQYEACGPINCGDGPNVSFPFYIPGRQESYCGYPGFELNCSREGLPVLQLPGNDYILDRIFYRNRSLHAYNSAVSMPESSICCLRIENTTLPPARFDYVGARDLYLFSGCRRPVPEGLVRYSVDSGCGGGHIWDLAIYEGDSNLGTALEACERNVVAPVGVGGENGYGEGTNGISNIPAMLRSGFVLNWTASDCNDCADSGGHCGFNATNFHFRCFCPDRPHSRSCKPDEYDNRRKVLTISIASGGGFLLVMSFAVYILCQRKKRVKENYLFSRSLSFDPSSKADIEGGGSFYFGIPIFSYKELEEATNKFDPSKELGDGGFGTVYYGKLHDGREVAIKRLYENNYRRVQQFMNEIKILTTLRHQNLVSLYGCTSRRSRELLLVYEYVPNATLADHLHGDRALEARLPWPSRMRIALETAGALSYLHKSDIIHRDVKTNNILLDDSFHVKVADFGLSRLFPNDVTHVSTAPQGTPGYVDPEYHQYYQLTDKSDVYSFGVVLIELISSMPPVDITRHRHDINLANLALNRIKRCAFDELIDPKLGYGTDAEVTRMTTSVAELAFRCLQPDKEMRPCMDEVVGFLREVASGIDLGKVPPSPETDESVLLKAKKLRASPNGVMDAWASSSSTTSTSVS
ncbi:Probable serine/threonine-protein kinase [Striga hermonthica]|uniref:non-specific serine/threonine protein kinase n=1 Tax=Striga hermonthica TaxID=68872 RepID=A0A9N7MM30_STRHE|nr:Probable serine/threonine-protein kinase [Striga hermonthica]